MAHNYTGGAAGIAAHEEPIIAVHDDADQFSAAVANAPLTQLADLLAYLQANAALRGAIETALFSGAAGDTNAALQLGGVPVTRKLKARLDGSEAHARIYTTPFADLEITLNAAWNGTQWVRDTDGDASRVVISYRAFAFYTYPMESASPFNNSAWELRLKLPGDGRIGFLGTTTGEAGSNPPAATALANVVCAKNTLKAWASVQLVAGVPTLVDGFNVASVAVGGTENRRLRINFAQAMGSASYAVQVSANNVETKEGVVGLTSTRPGWAEKNAAYVEVGSWAEPDWTPLGDKTVTFDVLVFGVQTT